MCLTLYTSEGKVFACPVQVFYSIRTRSTDQFKPYTGNILWKNKFYQKGETLYSSSHIFNNFRTYSRRLSIQKCYRLSIAAVKSRKVMTKKVTELSLYMLLVCKTFILIYIFIRTMLSNTCHVSTHSKAAKTKHRPKR